MKGVTYGRPILERSSNHHVARKRSIKKRTFTPNAGRCDVVIAHAQLEQELPLSSSDSLKIIPHNRH